MFSEGEARGGFGEAICCCEARLDLVVGGEAVEAMELRSGAISACVASYSPFSNRKLYVYYTRLAAPLVLI